MFLLFSLLWCTITAHGADTPRHRLHYDNASAVRINPLGLMDFFNLAYRLKLLDSESVLFSDTYVSIGPSLAVSPAWVQPGARLRIVPIAILELEANYRYTGFFGSFDQLQSWTSVPEADWSDRDMDATSADSYPTAGHQVSLQARLQAKVGPIAVRNTLK